MDFRDTEHEAAFRGEAVAWLTAALRRLPATPAASRAQREARARSWQEMLHEGGWAGLSWPVEYGGRGLTSVYEAIFNAEAGRRGAPRPINFLAMMLTGPTILVHGTDEQKRRFLPRILSGDEIWCQGFSEPESGSDLAGLRTRGDRTDGGWVVNGHKMWTSFAHIAQRCMLLVSTDPAAPRHGGMTYLCAPMESVEVSPITMINGDVDFNEVRWVDAYVSDNDVLGAVGQGWLAALTTLSFERGALSLLFYVEAQQTFDELVNLVRLRRKIDDPRVVADLGRLHAEVDALHLTIVRQLSDSNGRAPGPEGAIPKLVWSRLMQEMTRLALEVGDRPAALVSEFDADSWTHRYLRARGNSIEGGTSEILRSIVAERLLSLPRSR